ncbi:hypothetical protein [Marivita sp.]|uniref:hypothetical protein n=1 Tax=Marivita sp. TaxID=2003365 RepID=UPI0025C31C76|nr:hypothetical protein [Marivita sp.]
MSCTAQTGHSSSDQKLHCSVTEPVIRASCSIFTSLMTALPGLLFIVPGHGDTLRISGKSRIVRDETISKRLSVKRKQPLLALVVDVQEVFMHCAKAFIRSRLWQPDHWPERKISPTLAEWVVGTVVKEQTLEQVQAIHMNDQETRLY